MELDSCSMATTRAEITECVVENVRALSAVLSDAIFPEGIGH